LNITLYDVAQRFIGVQEVPGNASNPAVLAMLKLDGDWPQGDDVPWCSAFVNYAAWLLRLPRSKSLAARSWLTVGKPVTEAEATAGYDVVVLKRPPSPTAGHVGLFAGWDGKNVLMLGGNQGDKVCVAPYAKSRIIGIRRLWEGP
jgi:uncharacterized protein (TIGR02594 family)